MPKSVIAIQCIAYTINASWCVHVLQWTDFSSFWLDDTFNNETRWNIWNRTMLLNFQGINTKIDQSSYADRVTPTLNYVACFWGLKNQQAATTCTTIDIVIHRVLLLLGPAIRPTVRSAHLWFGPLIFYRSNVWIVDYFNACQRGVEQHLPSRRYNKRRSKVTWEVQRQNTCAYDAAYRNETRTN